MAKYFRYAFAVTGDRATVPDVSTGGNVGYDSGYGEDYSRNRLTDPLAKNIERNKQNQLFYDITSALKQYQENGTPDYITSADNGGVAYSYAKNSVVRYNDGVSTERYISLIDSNNTLPTNTSNWKKMSSLGAYLDLANDFTAANSFIDNLFTLKDNADNTKTAQFDLSGFTTGTLRTLALPNVSSTLVALSSTNAFTGSNSFIDANFQLLDDVDATKTARFQLSGLTTGTNAVYTLPNLAAATLATISTLTQTFSGTTTFSGTFTASGATATLGSSTAASTYGVGSGATIAAATKTINIGTAGVSTSITNINIGSAVSGALGTLTINSPTRTAASPLGTFGNLSVSSATVAANGLYLPAANTPTISANSLQVMRFATVASAVNYLIATNSATANAVQLSADGTDANISLTLAPKGTGLVNAPGVNFTGSNMPANGVYLQAANTLGISANTKLAMILANNAASVNYWSVAGSPTASTITAGAVGTDTNIPVGIFSKGNESVRFYTQGGAATGFQVAVIDTASAVNRMTLTGSATGNNVVIGAVGTDTNVGITLTPQGAGIVSASQLRVTSATTPGNGLYLATTNTPTIAANSFDVARFTVNGTAVNYFTFVARATGAAPQFVVSGSDANISMDIYAKGTGSVNIFTDGAGTPRRQFQVNHIASAVNYVTQAGSATGNACYIAVEGSDTNIPAVFGSKGTGSTYIGSYNTGQALEVQSVAGITNYFRMTPGASGFNPTFNFIGGNADIDAEIVAKGTGVLRVLASYTNSTTGTANVIIDTLGRMRRTTSMLKYKTDIEDVEMSRALDVFERVRPIWFRDKRDPGVSHYSVIAEDIAAIDPRLAHYGLEPLDTFDENGIPELGDKMVPVGVQMERVLLMVFVATREKIKALEAENAEMKKRLDSLDA